MTRRLTIVAVGAALVVAACGGSATDDAQPDPAPAPTSAATPASTSATTRPAETAPVEPQPTATQPTATPDPIPDAVVPELLRFTAPLVGGGRFDAATTAGTPTAFWFWAPT